MSRTRIVPSSRLLWLAAIVALPAVTAIGLSAALVAPGALLLIACAAAGAVDAVLAARRAAQWAVRAPEIVRLTKDAPAGVPFTIENRSAKELRVRAAVAAPDGIAPERLVEEIAAPPGPARFEWSCTPAARGDFTIPELWLETPSPLGLWTARTGHALHLTLRVYPNLRDRATASLFLRTANPGLRRRPRLGRGREFDNLRHYLAGDTYEDIDWKATARRGIPIVKLYQVEHAQEVYAILDSSRLSAREGILEGYVNAALHLALVAQQQGDRFGLVTFSNRPHRFLRARAGLSHFRLCREAIYNLRAGRVSPDFREVFTTLQLNLRRRALLVFFTSLDDPLLAETFAQEIPLIARRHLVLVNVTETPELTPLFRHEPPADLDAAYRGLAAQALRNRMREVQLELENKGVRLALVPPDRIKSEVTFQYLEVKRRQAL